MSSPGCLYWQDPQSHQTSSSNMRRDPCLEARSPDRDVNRIISGRTSFPPPRNSVRPSGGLFSGSQCTLPFHLLKSLFPGPLLSVASFLTSPTIRHICFYWRQTRTVIPQPRSPGCSLSSRWASNHPSKPQADGATLASFAGVLVGPIAPSIPRLGF